MRRQAAELDRRDDTVTGGPGALAASDECRVVGHEEALVVARQPLERGPEDARDGEHALCAELLAAGLEHETATLDARDDAALVEGCERTWAAGDGVVSPVKFGGLATHQARRAVAAIARLAGVANVPDPGEPVLQGRLLIGGGRTRRLAGRGDAAAAPLWWPAGKVSGEYLPRWLSEHGITAQHVDEPPEQGITICRPLRDMQGPEARYLYELARQFRSADPALGRRTRETRER